jgi:hypothetical protein
MSVRKIARATFTALAFMMANGLAYAVPLA